MARSWGRQNEKTNCQNLTQSYQIQRKILGDLANAKQVASGEKRSLKQEMT